MTCRTTQCTRTTYESTSTPDVQYAHCAECIERMVERAMGAPLDTREMMVSEPQQAARPEQDGGTVCA